MSEHSLPSPEPRVTPETKPFWDATTRGELLLPICNNCGTALWYPKTLCSACSSVGVTWTKSRGTGVVYTYTIMRARRAAGAYGDSVPYIVAIVELDEGPRLMTNVVECEIDAINIGQRVEVVFGESNEVGVIPRFRPIDHVAQSNDDVR